MRKEILIANSKENQSTFKEIVFSLIKQLWSEVTCHPAIRQLQSDERNQYLPKTLYPSHWSLKNYRHFRQLSSKNYYPAFLSKLLIKVTNEGRTLLKGAKGQ